MPALKEILSPRKLDAISKVLAESYSMVEDFPFMRKSAKSFRDAPKKYIGLMKAGYRGSFPSDHTTTQELNWASWELARGAFDESSKSLMLSTLAYWCLTNKSLTGQVKKLAPSWDLVYVSGGLVSNLYFSHYSSVLGGLQLVGVVPCKGMFLCRNIETDPVGLLCMESGTPWEEDPI